MPHFAELELLCNRLLFVCLFCFVILERLFGSTRKLSQSCVRLAKVGEAAVRDLNTSNPLDLLALAITEILGLSSTVITPVKQCKSLTIRSRQCGGIPFLIETVVE